MISITSIGGDVGFTPKRHQHEQAHRAPQAQPTPRSGAHPDRGEHDHELQERWIASCVPRAALRLLLELRADQVLEREHLVPLLLRQQLALLDDDLVQRLAGLVALARDLRALLVAERTASAP
jgi:hypothetical protein